MGARMVAEYDQEDAHIKSVIRRFGCFLQYVQPCTDERDATVFCYTVGLFGLGHPELLVFGLDQPTAAAVLNGCFHRVRAGRDLVPGEVLRHGHHGLLVEQLPNPGEIVLQANHFYQRPPSASVPALQLTWEVGGAFPMDRGYPLGPHVQPRPGLFSALHSGDGECTCDE